MKIVSAYFIVTTILSCTFVAAMSVNPPPTEKTQVGRRTALETAGALSLSLLAASPANAEDASSFVGTYADPINHPGGKRVVRLVGGKVGDYQLAEVEGGGGKGEPDKYVLPAAILGGRTIVIDFSVPPKNGPKDFVGVLDDKKGIRFLKDGNTWPRL